MDDPSYLMSLPPLKRVQTLLKQRDLVDLYTLCAQNRELDQWCESNQMFLRWVEHNIGPNSRRRLIASEMSYQQFVFPVYVSNEAELVVLKVYKGNIVAYDPGVIDFMKNNYPDDHFSIESSRLRRGVKVQLRYGNYSDWQRFFYTLLDNGYFYSRDASAVEDEDSINRRRVYIRCKVCDSKATDECLGCNKNFCSTECFQTYHK